MKTKCHDSGLKLNLIIEEGDPIMRFRTLTGSYPRRHTSIGMAYTDSSIVFLSKHHLKASTRLHISQLISLHRVSEFLLQHLSGLCLW